MRSDRSVQCPGCQRAVPAYDMMVLGRLTDRCTSCQAQTAADDVQPRQSVRLLQELRHTPAHDLTPREAALVAAAQVVAGRRWAVDVSDQEARWQRAQRLHAALFAAGCDVTAGNYPEAARLAGRITIDFVPGNAGDVTDRLLELASPKTGDDTAHLLITHAALPPAAIDAFERHAGRPIGVYPQANEA